jgi:Mn-dependent DtxR family transcriptional regulator
MLAHCTVMNSHTLAAHVIVALADAQEIGRSVRLDELASDLGVRKPDVREIVTSLHAEGHVDALRLRLTMTGLALAASLSACKLHELRPEELAPISRVA